MDFAHEIAGRVALTAAMGRRIAFWRWDEKALALIARDRLLDGVEFCLASDWEGHHHLSLYGRRVGTPDAMAAANPDEVIVLERRSALTAYEYLLRLGIDPLRIYLAKDNWSTRLHQPDPAYHAVKAQVPATIQGGLSCEEIVCHCFDCIRHIAEAGIHGDFVNLGIFQGWSLYFIAAAMEHFGLADRKLIGFDTFEGFIDTGDARDVFCDYQRALGKTGRNFFKNTSIEAVAANLAPFANIDLRKGDICDTVSSLGDRPIAFALFDMDDYVPTRAALEPIFQRLSHNGVFLFDHFSYHTLADGSAMGQRLAMLEFLERHRMFNLNGTNVFIRV